MASSCKNTIVIPDDDDDLEYVGSNSTIQVKTTFLRADNSESFYTYGAKKSIIILDGEDSSISPSKSHTNYISNLTIRSSPNPRPRTNREPLVGFQDMWDFPMTDRNAKEKQASTPSPTINRVLRTPSPCTEPVGGSISDASSQSNSEKKRRRSFSTITCQNRSRRLCMPGSNSMDNDIEMLSRRYRSPTVQELEHVLVQELDNQDDEIFEVSNGQLRALSSKKTAQAVTADYQVIDLDDQEDLLEREAMRMEEFHKTPLARASFKVPQRNEPMKSPWRILKDLETSHGTLKSGKVVELKGGDFLYITAIVKNPQTEEHVLRGLPLQRSRDLNGMLPRKVNELCWRFDIDLDDPRHCLDQNIIDKEVSQVVKLRHLRVTNQNFPIASFRETGGFSDVKEAEKEAPCVARWKFCAMYQTALDRLDSPGNRWQERSLVRIESSDYIFQTCRGTLVVDDREVRHRYRGETVPGGSSIALQRSQTNQPARNMAKGTQELIDLTAEGGSCHYSQVKVGPVIDLSGSDVVTPPSTGMISPQTKSSRRLVDPKKIVRASGQKYTYGDCFCGAGGTTRGALMAGLQIKWGFDGDHHACASWKLNFSDAHIYTLMADEFVKLGRGNDQFKVDIMHLSPPCQVWSPAHTTPGRDDERNLASLFACRDILDTVKPRVATLEQTFGIVNLGRFQAYFRSLILMFTDNGYSVRWKVALLQNWGLPQRRQRLIMIASCPGEVLPEFPPFTHADPRDSRTNNGELKPWTSVNSVLESIPYGAENHNIEEAMSRGFHGTPWSGESIVTRCITTHGGQNYHPSGSRPFTEREFAALQGFPHCHRFTSVNIKKQIGNAVPPAIAKILFESIRKALEKADGVEPDHITID